MAANVRRWAVVALCYLAVLEIVSLWQSPAFGPCLVNPQQESASANNNQKQACPTFSEGTLIFLGSADKFFEHHDKSILAIFTIVLAVSTTLLWWSTDKLWRAGERQMELIAANATQQTADMRESLRIAAISAEAAETSSDNSSEALALAAQTAERQLRAYFDMRSAKVDNFEIGEKTTVFIRFRNVGQTPALNVTLRMVIGVRDLDDPPPNIEVSDEPASQTSVGSRGRVATRLSMNQPLSKYSYDAVAAGTAALFANGIIRYEDVYGRTRHFRFRMAFTSTQVASEGRDMEVCPEGNDAD